jgi:hypothetical protein
MFQYVQLNRLASFQVLDFRAFPEKAAISNFQLLENSQLTLASIFGVINKTEFKPQMNRETFIFRFQYRLAG